MVMDGILALGLLFTTSSQFRVPGMPIGPGEICLAVWIVGKLVQSLVSGERFWSPDMSPLIAFWGLFALALSLGMMTALATEEAFEPGLVLHDATAYPFVAAVGCLSAATPFRLRRIAWFVATAGAASLAVQFANGIGLIAVPEVDPWFWERFRGWSSNPNQLSILCGVVLLVALHLADTAASISTRLAAIVCVIPPFVLGRMSQSDTFTLAVVAALPVWCIGKLFLWLRIEQTGLSPRASLAWLAVLATPVLLLCLAPIAISEAGDAQDLMKVVAKNNGAEAEGEAKLRMTLWGQALARGVESGLLGLGPGPHLQIPPEIVAGRDGMSSQLTNIEHPTQNGTANFEAHNTVLDLFTQGGLLAVASFVGLLLGALVQAWRARSVGLIALVTGVAIFIITGNIVRQPIFWFAIVLCLTARTVASPSRMPAQSVWQ
jgi:O-antigen ligase